MSNKIKNSDFGAYIAPLVKPMYVLQMARSKSWSADARLRNVGKLRAACVEVIKRIDRNMERLCEDANREEEHSPSDYGPNTEGVDALGKIPSIGF